jgi:hypothetical protein
VTSYYLRCICAIDWWERRLVLQSFWKVVAGADDFQPGASDPVEDATEEKA